MFVTLEYQLLELTGHDLLNWVLIVHGNLLGDWFHVQLIQQKVIDEFLYVD